MINAIDMMNGQLININGLQATVDGKSTKILITEASENTIVTDQPLHEGSFIEVNEKKYLVVAINEQFNQGIYKSGIFEKTLPILLGSSLKPVNAVVSKYRGQYVDGQLINEVHDQYIFKISKNDTNMNTLSIGNDLIIYDKGQYNILSVDNTQDGILIITGKFDTIYIPHTYTISLNSSTQTIVQGEIFQLVATTTDNSQAVTNPTIEWTSSNEAIATVSNGLITGIGVGSCTISATFKGVSAIVNLTVNEKPSIPVISYASASSNGYIYRPKEGSVLSFTKLVDTVPDVSLKVAYSLDSLGTQLLSKGSISITTKTDSSFTIRNVNISTLQSFYITVTDSANGTKILDNKQITLKGM